MVGLVLFALASLAGGLATNSGQLIAARAVQGLGAAILSPAALSIVATTFSDGAERNKALGIWGAVAGSGGAAGVLLGGVLTECLGWEWVLWVNVPIGDRRRRDRAQPDRRNPRRGRGPPLRRRRRGDDHARPLGPGLRACSTPNSVGWGSAQTIGTLVGSALLLAAFVVDRAALAGAARALLDLPHPHDHRRQRGRPPGRRLAVLDVLLHLPLHAAGARLQPDQGRPLLPAAGGLDHPLGRDRLAAGDQSRLQADPRRRHGADRRRPRLVLARSRSTAPSSATSSAPRCWPRSASASPSSRSRSPPSPGSRTASRASPAA